MEITNDLESLKLDPNAQAPAPATKELDRDAFLRIFLTQLQSQDPLSPQDSSELSSQLAQFSQLEQSVNTTSALEGISTKLDQLIDVTRGGSGSIGLDPVSLLGRRVEFQSDTLAIPLPDQSSSADLSAVVPSGTQALVVQVFDESGARSGVFSLTRTPPEPREVPNPDDPNGPPIVITPELPALPEGEYRISFQGTQPTLSGPTGTGSITFNRLTQIDGQFARAEDAEGNPIPFDFDSGARYRFALQSVNLTSGEEPTPLSTTRSAIVESVRVVDGERRISAGGVEIDPSQITQIRNEAR